MVTRRLIALVALGFLATHCVEIDDRDLEEHDGDDDNGGSSNGGSSRGGSSSGGTSNGGTSSGGSAGLPIDCQRDSDDTDCFACQKAFCCDDYQACFAASDCLLYVSCGAGCNGDSPCIAACGDEYPEGEALFGEFTNCGDILCADTCAAG